MIGGAMLLCAVSAMVLIALWSITRDDAPDAKARGGILALRTVENTERKTTENRPRRKNKQHKLETVNLRPRAAQRPRALRFDPNEMAEIAEEAEATLPGFVRESREEY